MLTVLCALFIACIHADVCNDLCRTHPACRNGSHKKNGFCHSLYYVPETDEAVFCVHNSATRSTCLSSFEKVSIEGAAALLMRLTTRPSVVSASSLTTTPLVIARLTEGQLRGLVPVSVTSEQISHLTDAAVEPPTTERSEFVTFPVEAEAESVTTGSPIELKPTLTTGLPNEPEHVASEPGSDVTTSLPMPVAETLSTSLLVAELSIANNPRLIRAIDFVRADLLSHIPRQITRLDEFHRKWALLGGPLLMNWVENVIREPESSDLAKLNAVEALMTLATNLSVTVISTVTRNIAAQFAQESGLSQFCESYSDLIVTVASNKAPNFSNMRAFNRKNTLKSAGNVEAIVIEFGAAADWDMYCPSVMGTTRLRGIALRNRLVREIAAKDTVGDATLRIERKTAFEDSVHRLIRPVSDNRGYLEAQFTGEEGFGPGVLREYFAEVAAQIYREDYGLLDFRTGTEPHYTRISMLGEESNEINQVLYSAIGRFLGLAILNDIPVGVTFPIMFFAHLLDQQLELSDIGQDEPALYRYWMDAGSVPGDTVISINGVHTLLDRNIREELMKRQINSLLTSSELVHIEIIKRGFLDVIPLHLLEGRLSPKDLKELVHGNSVIDIDDMRRHVVLNGFSSTDDQVKWLFNLLESFNQSERSKFLRFVTSNPRLPLEGFAFLAMPLTIDRIDEEDNDALIPTRHTCYYKLHLPMYSTESVLRQQVTFAINADPADESIIL